MSLLLDALKQAEANKKSQQAEAASQRNELPEENSHSEMVSGDEHLVELEILPEFDLTPEVPETSPPELLPSASETTLSVLENEQVMQEEDLSDETGRQEVQQIDAGGEQPARNEAQTVVPEMDKSVPDRDSTMGDAADVAEPLEATVTKPVEPPTEPSAKPAEPWPQDQAAVAQAVLKSNSMARLLNRQWGVLLIVVIISLMLVCGYWLWQFNQSSRVDYYQDSPVAVGPDADTEAVIEEATVLVQENSEEQTALQPKSQVVVAKNNDRPMPTFSNKVSREQTTPSVEEEAPRLQIKIKRAPRKVDSLLQAAYRLYQQQHYQQARQRYQQVLKQDPQNLDAMLGLGSLAEQRQDADRARYWYEKVLQQDRSQGFAWMALMRLDKRRTIAEKQQLYQSLIKKQPDNPVAYAALAELYLQQQKWREAQRWYFKAVEYDKDNPVYYYNLAVCLDHMQKPGIAEDYYRKARAMLKNAAGTDILQRIDSRLGQ